MSEKVEYILSIKDLASGSLKTIALSANNAGNAMDKTKAKAGGLGSSLGKLGVVAGLTALAFKGFNFLKESVDDFDAAAQAGAQLDATLKSTSYSAGLSREALDEQSLALSKMTKFDDDAITSMQSLLLTFTEIKGKVFQEATPAILDLAEKMGGDLKGASIQVGKALNDPIKGVSALGKVGVSFTEGQKKTIKSLVETGKVADAQRIILAELNKEFGGSAEAAANAGTGGLTVLANRFGNIKESIGELVVGGINKLYPKLRSLMSALEGLMEIVKNTSWGDFFETIKNSIPAFDLLQQLFTSFSGAFSSATMGLSTFQTIIDSLTIGIRIMTLPVRTLVNTVMIFVDTLLTAYKVITDIKNDNFSMKSFDLIADRAKKTKELFTGLFDLSGRNKGEEKKTTLKSLSTGSAAGGAAGTGSAGSKTASMASASKPTQIYITIDSLVKNMNIQKEGFKESVMQIKSSIAEGLIGAVNDSQRVAGA